MEDDKIIELYWERSETAIKETQTKYGRLNRIPPQRPNSLSAYCCKITRNLAMKKFEYNIAQDN